MTPAMPIMSSKLSSNRSTRLGLSFVFVVLASAALVLIPAVLGILMMEWERVSRSLRKAF
jgi:hypothetical protein